MVPLHATPLLLSLIVGLLLGLLGWGALRAGRARHDARLIETHDDLLLGLIVLAAFAFGAFLTYILLSLAV